MKCQRCIDVKNDLIGMIDVAKRVKRRWPLDKHKQIVADYAIRNSKRILKHYWDMEVE